MIWVIDASVLIKAYIPECGSEQAGRVLCRFEAGEVDLVAPDLIYPETGNILWKKVRREELMESEAQEIADAISGLPLQVESGRSLMPMALDIAMTCGVTVYDALYVALATAHETQMLTADGKLVSALVGTDYRKNVVGLEAAEISDEGL